MCCSIVACGVFVYSVGSCRLVRLRWFIYLVGCVGCYCLALVGW